MMARSPDVIWDNLLSREDEKVLSAFNLLTEEEKTAVLVHLKRMVEEGGWHEEQQKSARCALEALRRGGKLKREPD